LIQVIKVHFQRLVNRILDFLLGLLWGKIIRNDGGLNFDGSRLVAFGLPGFLPRQDLYDGG